MNKNKKSVKYSYINKKQVINQINHYEQINSENKNKINKTTQNNFKKNSDVFNNSDFIRDLIAFSKMGQKKINQKDNNNQRNNISKIQKERMNELHQKNRNNKFYDNKIIYKSSEISPNKNYFEKMNTNTNMKYHADNINNQKRDYASLNNNNYPQFHISKIRSNNINDKFGKTERNSPIKNNEQKKLRKNNTLTKFFISRQKKEKPMPIDKSLLNVTLSQVMESPLFGQIKEPKEGHSKGIIQLIKYSKNSPDYKKGKDVFDNENLNLGNKVDNKRVQYLQDKKMFDEPINNNHKQKNKINNNGNAIYIHNKTLSFNKLNNNEALFTLNKNLSYININDKKDNNKEKVKDNSSIDNKNDINKGLYNNNIKNKKLHNKINSEQVFNNTNNSNIKKHWNNLQRNISILKRISKRNHDLNSYNNIDNQIHSPSLINQKVNYKNQYLNSNILNEKIIDNLNSNKFNNNYLSNENIHRKDRYDLNNYHSKDKYEDINNKTNSIFFNANSKIKSKETSKKIELLKTETHFSKFNKFRRRSFINNNNITINKTNIQNKENSNILYLKPKNNHNNKRPSFHRNKTENNSLMHTNDLSEERKRRIKKSELFIEDDEDLFSNNLEYKSPPKSPNQIYRKPITKNNILEISKSGKTINNNFIIYKDEINFINKSKEYNINNEHINVKLNFLQTNFVIKEKVLNKKANFFTKYYQYNIKKPKIDIYLLTKEYHKYSIQMKMEIPLQCMFTKVYIVKIKKLKTKNINTDNKFSLLKNDYNKISNKNQLRNDNNINNDIIYLLNIITSKNILNVENQLTKLIIISKNAFNIKNNMQNAILFINDIISNIRTFISILVNKAIKENKYIELYIKLCSDLSNKYLNSINELIIKKYLVNNIDNNKYNIILNFINILNQESIKKCENLLLSNNNEEIKQYLLNLLNFVYLSIENNISNIDTFIAILTIIINKCDKIKNMDSKHYLIYLIIQFLLKLNKNNFDEKNNNIIEQIFNKIKEINKNETPKYLNKVIEKFINVFCLNKLNENSKDYNNEQKTSYVKLIKEDFVDYINFLKNKKNDENKFDFKIIKNIKRFEIENILKDLINIFIGIITKEEELFYYKSYIKNIFKPIFGKMSLNKLRIFHNNILLIISDINQFCKKNIFSYEIFGYLIYLLIENELCDVQDMNIFIKKNEESKINVCKVIKYIILSSELNCKKYYENFKGIDLFKNNSLFEDYIKIEINSI